MIVMDRENLWAKGWSHVLSTSNDVAELKSLGVAEVFTPGAPTSEIVAFLRSRVPA